MINVDVAGCKKNHRLAIGAIVGIAAAGFVIVVLIVALLIYKDIVPGSSLFRRKRVARRPIS